MPLPHREHNFDKPRRAGRTLSWLTIVVCGALLTAPVALLLRRVDRENARAGFQALAEPHFDALQSNIALTLNDLASLAAFCQVSGNVARPQFERLAREIVTRDRAILALEWTPLVTLAERRGFEAAARASGLASFQITERQDGLMARAADRARYFPVFLVEPLAGNERVLGFDVASNAARRESLERALESGQPSATGRVRLVQDNDDESGFLVFCPVYRAGDIPAEAALRRQAVRGLVLGVFRVNDMVARTDAAAQGAANLVLAIRDRDAGAAEQLLYPQKGPPVGGIQAVRTISVAGRTWEIAAYPVKSNWEATRLAFWAVLGGCLLTVACGLGLKLRRRRAAIPHEGSYRQFFEAAPEALLACRNGSVVLANPAAARLFRSWSPSFLVGKKLGELAGGEAAFTASGTGAIRALDGARVAAEWTVGMARGDATSTAVILRDPAARPLSAPPGAAARDARPDGVDFDLAELLRKRLEHMAIAAQHKGLEVAFDLAPELPTHLYGDAGALAERLVRMLTQAVESLAAGEIVVRVESANLGDTSVDLRFCVMGASGEGSGHHCSFTARFEKRPAPPGERWPWSGMKFLVVSAHAAGRQTVTRGLRSWGGKVEEAGDAAAAFEALLQAAENGKPFRVALLDAGLPQELAPRILAEPRLEGTILVLLAPLAQPVAADGLRLAGYAAQVLKPVWPSGLREGLAAALTEAKTPPAGGPRILIAEDNPTNQEVIRAMLDQLGYHAEAVSGGAEAIQALARADFDLVLMDCWMPEMDGYEATRRIRQGESAVRNPRIPILALTADAMPHVRADCLSAGMNDHLTKPVDLCDLRRHLETWLRTGDGEAAAGSPPAFQREDLLDRLMGNVELAQRVVHRFVESAPAQLAALAEAVRVSDSQEAWKAAHAIKGAAANAGGARLSEQALRLEQLGRAGDLAGAAGLLSGLESCFAEYRGEAEKFCAP